MPSLRHRLATWLLRTSPATPDSWLVQALGGGLTSAAGVTVDAQSALSTSAVYACVRILAETVASLPLQLYREDGARRTVATDHPLYPVLRWRANSEMTAFAWREVMMVGLALWGNAYAQIVRDNGGRIRELWPLRPDRVKVTRQNGALDYAYDKSGGEIVHYPAEQILHIAGLGFDGLTGLSPIGLARTTMGLAIAADNYGASFFGNSALPSGVLKHPGKLSDTSAQRIRRSWEEKHRGPEQAGRTAILEEGMEWQAIGLPPEDAQFLETRKFQVTDIARFYRIPPHMVGDLERATFSNIEQQSIEFVSYSLEPWLQRWTHSIAHRLLLSSERAMIVPGFDTRSLLRGDTPSRYQAYAVARQWGWYSANDVRALEGDNPIEDGDTYLVPLNMVPAGEPRPAKPGGGDGSGSPAPPKPTQVPSGRSETRSVAGRRRLAAAYAHPILSAAQRIVRRETTDVREAARRELGTRAAASAPQRLADFVAWLEAYYGGDRTAFIRSYMAPTIDSYAEAVNAEASDEVDGDPARTLDDTHAFADAYVVSFARRYTESSLGQLRAVANDAAAAGADVLAAIEVRLEQWQERRPPKVAERESNQANNAVAKQTYKGHGVERLQWDATGSACPYCASMDGQTVGIEDVFVSAGGQIQPVDGDDGEPMRTYFDIGHPPAHQACHCWIQPVVR